MTKAEVEALGGNSVNHTTSGCSAFVNEQDYWLGSPYDNVDVEWCVNGGNRIFDGNGVPFDYCYGLRPVVVVLKSNI